LNQEEFARLKHEVETRQTYVDKAFGMLDDFVRKHEERQDSPIGSARKEAEERSFFLSA
jgi:hypothetical protein